MLIIVNKENQSSYLKELASMHRLRKRIFKDAMKWPVNVVNGMEFDQFDTPDAHYIMHVNQFGEVDGCTRLLPTTKPYLLGDIFSHLIDSGKVPRQEDIWESTRFCSDTSTAPKNIMGLLAGGMLEFALSKGIHIRADFLYRNWKIRNQAKVDLILYLLFFFPGFLVFFWVSFDYVYTSIC